MAVISLAIASILLITPVGILAISLDRLFEHSRDEVARITSPAGRLDAVLTELNGGATTSFGHVVQVVCKGAKAGDAPEAAFLYGAGRNGLMASI